jgi:Cupin domain
MTSSATTGRRAAKTADGQGAAYWFYGDKAVLRSPDGVLPVIIEHHVGPGAAAPLHVHHDVDDNFYLLRGQLAMRCGDDTFAASAGDYVQPDLASLDYAAMNEVAGQTGQPVLGPPMTPEEARAIIARSR